MDFTKVNELKAKLASLHPLTHAEMGWLSETYHRVGSRVSYKV